PRRTVRGGCPLPVPRAQRLRRRRAELQEAVVDVTASAPRRLMTLYLPLSLASILLLFPFYWMLITSITTDRELIDLNGLPFWVFQPTLEHYRVLFAETGFLRWALNTLTISVVATAISLVCSILAGYALARLRFRGAAARS